MTEFVDYRWALGAVERPVLRGPREFSQTQDLPQSWRLHHRHRLCEGVPPRAYASRWENVASSLYLQRLVLVLPAYLLHLQRLCPSVLVYRLVRCMKCRRARRPFFFFWQAGTCKFLLHTAGLNITNRRPRLLRVGRVDTLHVAKGLRQSKRKREHVSSLPCARNVQRKNLLARMVSTRAPGCDDLKAHAPQ